MIGITLTLACLSCAVAMALTEGDGSSGAGNGDAGDGGQAGGGNQGGGGGQQQQQTPPAQQPTGFRLALTEEQRAKLLADGTLDLSDEQYTGGVRQQLEGLRRRASGAEKQLAEIAAAREETERKALEEQEQYKSLYEKERQAREKEVAGRKDDLIKGRFLLGAAKAGVVDPDAAFLIAKSLPGFATVSVDDEGKVAGLDELLTTLVKDKAYLVASDPKSRTVGSASNPGQTSTEQPPPKTIAEAGDRLGAWAAAQK